MAKSLFLPVSISTPLWDADHPHAYTSCSHSSLVQWNYWGLAGSQSWRPHRYLPHSDDQRKPKPWLMIRSGKGQGRDEQAKALTHVFWTVLQTCDWTCYPVHRNALSPLFPGRKGTYCTLRTGSLDINPSIQDLWVLKWPLDQVKKAYVGLLLDPVLGGVLGEHKPVFLLLEGDNSHGTYCGANTLWAFHAGPPLQKNVCNRSEKSA